MNDSMSNVMGKPAVESATTATATRGDTTFHVQYEDLGMAADLSMHSDSAPCLIFDEIPGASKGHRVLVNFFGGRRKNMTLGFPTEYSKLELSRAFLEHYLRDMRLVPHEVVSDGPIFENVLMGDDIDVTKFPTPLWHDFRRRALYRHGQLQHHDGSRREVGQLRRAARCRTAYASTTWSGPCVASPCRSCAAR